MLSFEIDSKITETENVFLSVALFWNALDELAAMHDKIAAGVAMVVLGGHSINSGGNSLHAEMSSVSAITAKISARNFYAQLELLRESLVEVSEINKALFNFIAPVLAELDQMAGFYDAYLSAQNPSNATPLIFSAHRLKIRLSDAKNALQALKFSNESVFTSSVDERVLTMYVPNAVTMHHFVSLLNALQSIYSELMQIFSFSEVDSPLRVCRIESGSLWVKLLGQSKIIELMSDFIRGAAGFVYRNYTTEGKISSVPSKLESLDQILSFSQKLKAAGVNVDEIEGQVVKGGTLIAKDLNRLLENQGFLVVDGDKLPVLASGQKIITNDGRAPLLIDSLSNPKAEVSDE